MKKMKTIVLAAVIIAVTLTSFYRCSKKIWTPEARAERITKKLIRSLNLNQEQKTKLLRIKNEILTKIKENKRNREETRNEVVNQIRKSEIDINKLNSVFSANDEKRIEFRKFFIPKFAEFHAVLTAEQRNKLADMILAFSKMFIGE